jgi:hypothetical protein
LETLVVGVAGGVMDIENDEYAHAPQNKAPPGTSRDARA